MYVTKQIQNKLQKKKINLHQRSILRQMMTTCDKLGNSFLTKQQSRKFEQREKQEKQLSRKASFILAKDENNEKDHSHSSHKSKNQSIKKMSERLSYDPFRVTKDSIVQDFVYIKESKQIKQIKDLKEKMLPKVNKTNIEKKLKQLTYIRNMGYKSKNKKLQSFKSLTRFQDEEQILNQSWNSFYQDRLNSSPTQTPYDSQLNFTINERSKPKKGTFLVQKSQFSKTLNLAVDKASSVSGKNLMITSFFPSESKQNSLQLTTISNCVDSVDNKKDLGLNLPGQKPRPIRVSTRNKTGFKELLQSIKLKNNSPSETKRYPLSSQRKKQITQQMGLTKQKLQKQNAYKLYSLIKGGYSLDRNDIQGQYISLKRFKQSKQNFMMLNNCFNKIREYRYVVQQPHKVFNDGSFKALVYLSQVEGKIANSMLKKVKEVNKVVG